MKAVRGLHFSAWWCSMLWSAMNKTGKGYRRPSLKRDGRGERRKDKTVTRKAFRSYAARYSLSRDI